MLRLAAIGLGYRASAIYKVMKEIDPSVELTALVDPDTQGVKKRLEGHGIPAKNIRVMAEPEDLAAKSGDFDGILIGTRCHLHAEMASRVAPSGLPLYLEKPVAISYEQLDRLAQAYRNRGDSVVVSFPLRATPLFTAALDVIRSGRLGTINQVQAINNVPYGGTYFGGWYRNFEQTGGLWLQKATHDVDCMMLLAGSKPVSVCAMISRRVFGGDKPAGLTCFKCDEKDTCVEGPTQSIKRGNDGQNTNATYLPDKSDHYCVFGEDIHYQDAGSAVIMYDNGVHGSYTQNFVSRYHATHRRGAIVTGHNASLDFDWHTEKLRVVDHHQDRVDNIEIKASSGHGGGDYLLAENFLNVMKGKEKSSSPLHDGMLSAVTCLAMRQSANTHTFQPVQVPGDPAPNTGPRALEALPT